MKNDAIILTIESVRTRASTSEALVTFALPLEQAGNVSAFMGKIGQQVGAAFVDIESYGEPMHPDVSRETKSPQGDYGVQAKHLRLSSFFRTPAVWRAVGTDEQFLDWLRAQPCAKCGHQDHLMDTGEAKCEAAHVRRVSSGSGTATKPEYSAIPLCHRHHTLQHNSGESALGLDFNKARIHYVSEWCWQTVKMLLDHDSWKNVPPHELRHWAERHSVSQYLPIDYLEKEDEEHHFD